MYFELYVDVLFLVNFFMDYILLLAVWKMLKCHSSYKRILAGAVLGSLLTCIVIILPVAFPILEHLLLHLGVSTCMIMAGLKINQISMFMKALILLYIGAFFMGGFLEAFQQYVKIGGLFFFLAVIGYYLTMGMWNFISKLQSWNKTHVDVTLFCGEEKMKMKGLVDTGNLLKDDVTGKPVSVICRKNALELLSRKSIAIRYIPYQTIGKPDGVMPVFCADRLCVSMEREYVIEKPIVGIAEEKLSGNEYEMILSPDLF